MDTKAENDQIGEKNVKRVRKRVTIKRLNRICENVDLSVIYFTLIDFTLTDFPKLSSLPAGAGLRVR